MGADPRRGETLEPGFLTIGIKALHPWRKNGREDDENRSLKEARKGAQIFLSQHHHSSHRYSLGW
jgi:hypothetical protein